jgi:hypothetical protein
MEKPVINPSFTGILFFHGCDRVLSVSNGRDIDYQEFNLSSLHGELQQTNDLSNTNSSRHIFSVWYHW